jgi:hypothetical protein
MDVEFLENEIIAYLCNDTIKRLKKNKSMYQEKDNGIYEDSEMAVSLEYVGEANKLKEENFDTEQEYFDDILDALEEVDQLLWQLECGDNFEDIKDDFDWKKVMRTYEYYDNIRQQYE